MFLAVEAYWDTGGTSSAHILQLKEHTQWWIAMCVCMCVCMCWQWGDKKCAQWLLYVWGCIHIAIYVRPITSPPERPRLQLQPRTKPLDDTSGRRERGGGGGGRNSSSIFGEAKPVDTLQKQIGCFNHRVVTPVADKLWLWEFYLGIRDYLEKATRKASF